MLSNDLKHKISLIKDYIKSNYKNNFREPCDKVRYPFIVPGANYTYQLWDWDSWLTGYALFGLNDDNVINHAKGSVLNFLDHMDEQGRIPILVQLNDYPLYNLTKDYKSNIHKPCLAIQANEIAEFCHDYSWLENDYYKLVKFLDYYDKNQKHSETGLYFWIDDLSIGFDNDPTVFYTKYKSTAPIFLNCLMYSELSSMSIIAKKLKHFDDAKKYDNKADELKKAIQEECFDNVDEFFYSVDISLRPVDPNEWLHSGCPRHWKSLPRKITTWAGMLPLWNKIATPEQAKACVQRYLNKEGLFSNYGIRSVAKNEKSFANVDSGNPSCWIGPIWINANYFTYIGLKNYGYIDLAKDIAIKTINLLGNDIEKQGEFSEYYHSETGLGIRGKGFQSWNFLVLRMIEDLENE